MTAAPVPADADQPRAVGGDVAQEIVPAVAVLEMESGRI